eukprot:s563_g27.t1
MLKCSSEVLLISEISFCPKGAPPFSYVLLDVHPCLQFSNAGFHLKLHVARSHSRKSKKCCQMLHAAANVQQFVEVLKTDDEKWAWLSKRVDTMLQRGQLLVFVKSIHSAEELSQNFQDFLGKKTEFLHGDLDQGERMRILKNVKKRLVDVLIATDVAARGLDLPSIFTVVSYDAARDIETHTHRVGRTGRAGAEGQALYGALL